MERLRHFCAYQERSPNEALTKLTEWGLNQEEAEDILDQLKQEGFVHESRFAETYARGKFRLKKWGKEKIRFELKKHRIAEAIITQALNSIEPDAYSSCAEELALRKAEGWPRPLGVAQKGKLYRYLAQKGFDAHIIHQALQKING